MSPPDAAFPNLAPPLRWLLSLRFSLESFVFCFSIDSRPTIAPNCVDARLLAHLGFLSSETYAMSHGRTSTHGSSIAIGVASTVSVQPGLDTDVGSYSHADSDIICLNALGSNIIVLNSLKAANALLDRRSEIYSGRSIFHISCSLMNTDYVAEFDW